MLTPIIFVLVLAGLFVLGLAVGYIYSEDADNTTASRLRIVIAVTVTVVWVVAMAADIFITGYTVSPLVHALMGAVVGYFFADNGLDINIGG